MKIKDMPLSEQPRERLRSFGAGALSDSEVLALILEKGTREENVIEMSSRIISRYGLEKLSDLSLQELLEVKGIGEAKAMQLIAIFELVKRCSKDKKSMSIRKASDVYKMMSFLKEEKKEHLYAIYLDSKNNMIDKPEIISIGTLDASLVHPRDIFKEAVRKSAKSFILIHNHPSSDTSPSSEDRYVTKQVSEAGRLMDIRLLDHIIIGEGYYSFREDGLLDG